MRKNVDFPGYIMYIVHDAKGTPDAGPWCPFSYFLLFYYIERVLCVYRNSQNSQNMPIFPKMPILPIFAYFGKIPYFCLFFTYIKKCLILLIFLYLRFLPIFASL